VAAGGHGGRAAGSAYAEDMEIIVVLLGLALLLSGPLAYLWGTDSRRLDEPGWFGSRRPR
jgi:hypothetical protein